ncbi:MAG TPA: nuclear transport factor 2 family protein [Terriglobales bacterium]|nr:nuclear transport factor 2 family protein [Terriglobales bacterium]
MSKIKLSGFVIAVLIALAPGLAAAASADDIEQLEQKRSQAILDGDMRTLDMLYASEFFYNRAGGDSLGKAAYFAFLTSGDIKVRRVVREEVAITVYGDTAVVTGIQHIDVNLKGQDTKVNLRYLHVWVNGPGGWKLVARQATNLPAEN